MSTQMFPRQQTGLEDEAKKGMRTEPQERPAEKATTALPGRPAEKGTTSRLERPTEKGATSWLERPAERGATSRLERPTEKGATSRLERPAEKGATSRLERPAENGVVPLLELSLLGMTCDGCADEIECELKTLLGVLKVEISYPEKSIFLVLDPEVTSLRELEQKLVEMGYRPQFPGRRPAAEVGEGDLGAERWVRVVGADGALEEGGLALDADSSTTLAPSGRTPTMLSGSPDGHSTLHRPDASAMPDHSGHHHHAHGLACALPPHRSHSEGSGRWVSLLGTASAVICLIHCLALPVLLGAITLLPALGSLLHGPVELGLVGLTLLLAWVSVGTSWRYHRRKLPMALMVFGTLMMGYGQLAEHEPHAGGSGIGMAGTVLLVASIWINRAYLTRKSRQIQLDQASPS